MFPPPTSKEGDKKNRNIPKLPIIEKYLYHRMLVKVIKQKGEASPIFYNLKGKLEFKVVMLKHIYIDT